MTKAPQLIDDQGQPALRREADGAILRFVQDATGFGKVRNVTQEPLDVYLHRHTLTREQYDAGEKLRGLHYSAHGSGYAAVNYAGVHGVADHSENWRYTAKQANAMRRLTELLDLLPRDERYVVERVVLWQEPANKAAQALGAPARRGISMLRAGLNTVASALAYGPAKRGSSETDT